MGKELALPDGYPELIEAIKAHVQAARTRAALAVNQEQLGLYWRIGKEILDREAAEGWGAKVIDRLAADLKKELPGMKGLSRSNLHYMRAFAAAWPGEIVPQAAGQIP